MGCEWQAAPVLQAGRRLHVEEVWNDNSNSLVS